MVGVPVGNNPTSLSEIAEACHVYTTNNSLTDFKNIYMTDSTRAGNGTTTDLKYSQFIGKNVAYAVTSTGLLVTNPLTQAFSGYSGFSASSDGEYFLLCGLTTGSTDVHLYNKNGTLLKHFQDGFGDGFYSYQSRYYFTNVGVGLSVSRSSSSSGTYGSTAAAVGCNINGSDYTSGGFGYGPYNAVKIFQFDPGSGVGLSVYFPHSFVYWWNYDYDSVNGFGTHHGKLVKKGDEVYLPCSSGLFDGRRTVTILYSKKTGSSTRDFNYTWSDSYYYGDMMQLSDNADRVVIVEGTIVIVYTADGTSLTSEQTLTSTEGAGYVFANSDLSVVLSGDKVWHRNGTTWTAADTSEIANQNVDHRRGSVSKDGTRIAYANGTKTILTFHYHKTNNKWYFTQSNYLGVNFNPNVPPEYGDCISIDDNGYIMNLIDGYNNGYPTVYKGTVNPKK